MKSSYRAFRARSRAWRLGIVICAFLLLADPALAAEAGLTGTFTGRLVGRDVSFERQGRPITNWAGTLNVRLDNGPNVPTFCIELDVRVQSGDRYVADGPIQQLRNGCQIRSLLQKHPASSVKSPAEAAALQMAIWHFSDGVDLTTIPDADRALRERALALVEEARQSGCPATRAQVPELTIEPATAQARVGEAVQYTVRVSPPGAASRVTVTLSGPAAFEDGQQRAELPLDGQGVASFRVLGMALGASSVQVELPYQLDAGTVFSHIEEPRKAQRLVMASQLNGIAQATAEISWTAQPQPTTQPTTQPTAQPTTQPQPTAQPTTQPQPTAQPTTQPQPTPAPAPSPQPTAPPEQPLPPGQPDTPKQPSTVQDAFPRFWSDNTLPAGQSAPQPPAQAAPQQQPPPAPAPQAAAPAPAPARPQAAAAPVRPRTLPDTGASAYTLTLPVLALAALLFAGGWLIRRRI